MPHLLHLSLSQQRKIVLSKKKPESPLSADFLIFTDGACAGNPGPGGFGAVVATKSGQITELGGAAEATTNNRMELQAVINALISIQGKSGSVAILTDSTYVIRGITQWIWGWQRKGWKNAAGEDVANKDQWMDLSRLVRARAPDVLEWHYSRGHVGTPGNERCDEIAVGFSKNQWVELYSGPLLKYTVAIHDIPENTELPEIKPKDEKKPAYSYLSYLGGVVYRHRDWGSCERRVKGQSGAKFKKAFSADEEKEILKLWGLAQDSKISGD
jgi:ribonuclease HI